MRDMKINNLIKNRSLASCVKDAANAYISNFSDMFKATWLYVLAAIPAMAIVGWATVRFFSLPASAYRYSSGAQAPLVYLGIIYLGDFVAYMLCILGYSRFFAFWGGFKTTACMSRCFKLFGFSILASIALSCLICGVGIPIALTHRVLLLLAVVTLFLIVVCIALMPFAYTGIKYIWEDKARLWKTIFGHYRDGLQNLSKIILATIVNGIYCTIAGAIVFGPIIILIQSMVQNWAGVLNGDVSSLPSYMTALFVACVMLLQFVSTYLLYFPILMVALYTYGSIEAKIQTDGKYDKYA